MLKWMHWTLPSGIGIGGVFLTIVIANILQSIKPSYPRKGFLPIETDRGDRIFISIISSIVVWILWLKFIPEISIKFSLLIVVPLIVAILKRG